MLMFFSSAPFYTSNVRFPDHNTPLSTAIHADPRFRFFDHCIGAVDGTHIRVFAPLEDHIVLRNRKGFLSQNCLFICDLNFFSFTRSQGGMAQLLMLPFGMTHALMICACPNISTF
jgi:hypothetical protein